MTIGQEVVDNEARVDIALLHQKIEHLSDNLSKHMVHEEKQKDKFEDAINGLGRRVGNLSKLLWLSIGVAGSQPVLELATQLPPM